MASACRLFRSLTNNPISSLRSRLILLSYFSAAYPSTVYPSTVRMTRKRFSPRILRMTPGWWPRSTNFWVIRG